MNEKQESREEMHLEDGGHQKEIDSFKFGDDEALKVLSQAEESVPVSAEEEALVKKKIDRWLMPVLFVTYGLQYTDKAVLSTAALFGLVQELKLFKIISLSPLIVDTGLYSQAALIFYVGFIVGALPLAAIAQRYPTQKVCSAYVLIWGVTLIASPACTNFSQIMAQRFFLGFMEAGVSPAFLSVIAMWYTKEEQTLRTGILLASNGLIVVPFLLLTYGIVLIGPIAHAWKVIYYFLGAFTIIWSAVVYLILPDTPVNAKFLNTRQRYVAISRLRANQAGITTKRFDMKQGLQAFGDLKVWLIFCITFAVASPGGAVGSFSTLVIQQVYGANARTTLLLLIPSGFIGGIVCLTAGYVSSRIPGTRGVMLCFFALISILGCALQWKLPLTSKAGLLAGVYLIVAYAGSYAMALSLAVSNTAGASKKTVVYAIIFCANAIGNIAGPLFFTRLESPRYPSGFLATMLCLCASVLLTIVYVILAKRENTRRDALPPTERDQAFDGLTDTENLNFRYVY